MKLKHLLLGAILLVAQNLSAGIANLTLSGTGAVGNAAVVTVGSYTVTYYGILQSYAATPLYLSSYGVGIADNPDKYFTNPDADHAINQSNSVQFSTAGLAAEAVNLTVYAKSGGFAIYGSNTQGDNGAWLYQQESGGTVNIANLAAQYAYLSVRATSGDIFISSLTIEGANITPEPSTYMLLAVGAIILLCVKRVKVTSK